MDGVDWGDAATWAGMLFSSGAIVVALLSWRAARCSASAAERSALAAEEQVALAREAMEAARNRLPWAVEPIDRAAVFLVNDSDEPAYEVVVASPQIIKKRVTKERVGPGEKIRIVGTRELGSGAVTAEVTWQQSPGEDQPRREWELQL